MSRPTTPTKEQIRAWIDNSDFLDEFLEDFQPYVDKAIDKSNLLDDLHSKLDYWMQECYDEGMEDGENGVKAEMDEEEIGCTFVIQKFSECLTLEDFKRELAWIESQALTYMR